MYNFFSNKLNDDEMFMELNVCNLVQDTIAVIILVWTFNLHARHDFYNHKADLYHAPHPFHDEQDIFTSIIIIVVTNLYAYYRLERDNPDALSNVDRSVDFAE